MNVESMNGSRPLSSKKMDPSSSNNSNLPNLNTVKGKKSTKLKSLILRIRLERDFEKQRQAQALAERNENLKQLTKLFHKRQQDFLREVPVRKYAPFMRSNDMPSYLMVLQSKVLRNLHQLCVIDSQKKLVEQQCAHQVGSYRKEMVLLVETKAKLEVQLLTAMAKVSAEENAMHESYESILSEQVSDLGVLQEAVQEEDDADLDQQLDDELDMLIDAIANESVEKLLSCNNKKNKKPPPSPKKLNRRSLTLSELLHIDGEKQKEHHGSMTEMMTDDESSSRMSLSAKMSQSFSHLIWKDRRNKVVSI